MFMGSLADGWRRKTGRTLLALKAAGQGIVRDFLGNGGSFIIKPGNSDERQMNRSRFL
jgi:hypothetical protein